MIRILAAVCLLAAAPAAAQQRLDNLSPAQMFAVADQARSGGDHATAETIYRALANDPDPEVRAEARFRHGNLLAAQNKFAEAAVLYRAILDEKPDAGRVRLELAAVLARLGDLRGAGRAMRQAQAGGLPPEVAQLVSQYQGALRSLRPYGASLELAFAPSTNINRATNATTLDTIIAPFELSADARAQSGIGLKLGGQAYFNPPLANGARAILRASTLANLYRQRRFNDVTGSAEAGVELQSGRSLYRALGGRSYRWFGGDRYAVTDSVTIAWRRTLGKRAQLETEAGAARADYRTNDLQDGRIFDASIALEQAFSARAGGRLTLSAQRQTARDPGYSTASAGLGGLLYAERGAATLYATANISRLEADARLFLFPERRRDWLYRLGAGATLRQVKLAGFAPVVRVNWERNASTVVIYDYRRFTAEIGITRAF